MNNNINKSKQKQSPMGGGLILVLCRASRCSVTFARELFVGIIKSFKKKSFLRECLFSLSFILFCWLFVNCTILFFDYVDNDIIDNSLFYRCFYFINGGFAGFAILKFVIYPLRNNRC